MLLDLKFLKNKYSLELSTIVHVGAHKGQEVKDYLENFPTVQIHLFEPQPKLSQYLEKKYKNSSNISLYNFALGSSNISLPMFLSSNDGESSSFYKPKEHLALYPDINFEKNDSVFEIKILDELNIQNIDLLNIDTQGFELEVLKGSIDVLTYNVKYILIEINKTEIYEAAPMLKDIDLFLKKYNFIRTDTQFWAETDPWGDAFYIKKELISFKRLIYTSLKNNLYTFSMIYKLLIFLRNTFWKLKAKLFNE
tara:strand:+ start:18237 stop:18992 length:756 start_codon:yes stop_codon:yes gene_type:complete